MPSMSKGIYMKGGQMSEGIYYKYIHFIKTGEKTKTKIWECRNNKGKYALGTVKWYAPWRQCCFMPVDGLTVFNGGCLMDITDFLEKVNGAHKASKS